MKIHRFNSISETLEHSQKELEMILSENASKSILLLCSGGSALNVLNNISKDVFTDRITVGVLDERFSNESTINNFIQLTNTSFYKDAIAFGIHFMESTPYINESLTNFGLRMNNNLRKWVEENSAGLVIIIQGMGVDGHTAGIMPVPNDSLLFESLFDNTSSLMIGYSSTDKYRDRVTVTNYFFKNRVDISIVYFVGEEKRDAYNKLKESSNLKNNELPIKILREMKDVRIFTNIT